MQTLEMFIAAFKMQFYWFLHHVDVEFDVSCRSEIELFQMLFPPFFFYKIPNQLHVLGC